MRKEIAGFLERERPDIFLPRSAVVEDFEGKVSVGIGADRPQAAVRVRFRLVKH
jgi:hypothetical protein